MTIRAVLIAAMIAAVTVVLLLFGPMTAATITGRPLLLDCGGREFELCEEIWHSHASLGNQSGPVTYVKLESDNCDVTIEISSFTFGMLGYTHEPLC